MTSAINARLRVTVRFLPRSPLLRSIQTRIARNRPDAQAVDAAVQSLKACRFRERRSGRFWPLPLRPRDNHATEFSPLGLRSSAGHPVIVRSWRAEVGGKHVLIKTCRRCGNFRERGRDARFPKPCRTEGTKQPTFVVNRGGVVNYICSQFDGNAGCRVPRWAMDFAFVRPGDEGRRSGQGRIETVWTIRDRPPATRPTDPLATVGASFRKGRPALISGSAGVFGRFFRLFLEKRAFFAMSLVAFSEKAS